MRTLALAVLVAGAATVPVPTCLQAQARPDLVVRARDAEWSVVLGTERGYAAVSASELTRIGWTVEPAAHGATLRGPEQARVELRTGTPWSSWNGEVLQFADAPYVDRGELRVPLQFVTDFLPRRLPDVYAFDGAAMRLTYGGAAARAILPAPEPSAAETRAPEPPAREPAAPEPAAPEPAAPIDDGIRVVVIDAGHGGKDPGSISRSGVQEKAVALGVALAMARELERVPNLEVHLLRDDDTFVEVWDRGAIATRLKGERPGIFVSVHANSFNSPARGFETYFLSDARTEHERRVAAIENAPLGHEEENGSAGDDLDFILRELKNLDTQHWSALLAEMIQKDVSGIHPGPDRGVKQAPLAVITNALMPAVLVELGYLSHPEEARLLGRPKFQEEAGVAIAHAVIRFFERYPPGAGSVAGAAR